MSALDQLIAKDLGGGGSALDALIARDGGAPAASTATQSAPHPGGGFLQSLYQGADDLTRASPFTDALAHHATKFFDGSALAVQRGLGAVGDYFDPQRQNPINQKIHSDLASDQAQLTQNEKDYQSRVANSPVSAGAGAVAGEIVPWLLPTNLPALGGKVADLAAPMTKYLPFQGAVNTAIKRGTEGAIIGGGNSAGDASDAGIGAAASVVLPPVVSRLAGGAANAARYANALINPTGAAGDAVGKLAATTTPSYASLLAAALEAKPADLATITGQPSQNFVNADPDAISSAVSDALKNMSGPQRLAAGLRLGATSPVPGVQYTADQALAPVLKGANAPMVQLNQAFRNSAGGANTFSQLDASNNAARLDYLQNFTKTPQELQALIDARRTAAQQAMGTTDELGRYTPGQFSNPVDPSLVLAHIDNLSNGSFGTDKVIKSSLADVKSHILQAADPDTGLVNPDIMDGIRQNLNGTIRQNANGGIVSSKQTAGLSPLANTITGSIEASNPGYGDYLTQYAKNSIPINTAEAANSLLSGDTGKLVAGSGTVGGDAQLTLPKITSAINSIDGMDYGVSPEFRQALGNVHQDLQNVSVSNSRMGSAGSPTAYYGNLSNQVGDAINGRIGLFENPLVKYGLTGAGGVAGSLTGLPGAETAGAGGLLGATVAGSHLGGARLQQGYIDMLTNPDALADHLSKLSDPPASALANYLRSLPVFGAEP